MEDYALKLKFGRFIIGTNCIRLTWDIWVKKKKKDNSYFHNVYAKSRLPGYDPKIIVNHDPSSL